VEKCVWLGSGVGFEEADAPKDADRDGYLSKSCLKLGCFYESFFAFAFSSFYSVYVTAGAA
ncbi:hypothetical protein Tco_1437763, partial [Tanacetum coccineum]